MAQGDTRSLHEIRRETEQTRAALTTTVEELRGTVTDAAADIKNRLRPDAIRAEVSGYVKSRAEQLVQDFTDMARRNPMQAVALGASVAYPALRLVRAMPLPVLMIGAGLFLSGSKTGRDLSRKASSLAEDLSDEAQRRASELGDHVSRVASDVTGTATDLVNRTGERIAGLTGQLARTGAESAEATRASMAPGVQTIRDAAGRTADAIAATADRIAQAAGPSARAVQQTAASASAFARETGARAAQSGHDLLDETRARASRFGEQAVGSVRDTVQQNPLLVAGLGLVIGAVIASALPKSDIEQTLAGDASSAVKRKARLAAAAGFDAAKGATGEIIANVVQRAADEGLTPDGLARSAQDIGQRVQRVAERAVTTAFDPDHHSDDYSGGRRHG